MIGVCEAKAERRERGHLQRSDAALKKFADLSRRKLQGVTRDQYSVHAQFIPICCEIGQGNAPIRLFLIDM